MRSRIARAIGVLPPVIRPLAGLVVLLALFWLPAVTGLRAAFSLSARNIPDTYADWWLSVRAAVRTIRSDYAAWRAGTPQDADRKNTGEPR